MSSQNARRLARLCLSYSNRWLHSFEGTHKLALGELARTLPSASVAAAGGVGREVGAVTRGGGTQGCARGAGGVAETGNDRKGGEQTELLKRLTEELFS